MLQCPASPTSRLAEFFGWLIPFPSFLTVGLWLLPAIWLVGLPLYGFSGMALTRYVGSRSYHLGCAGLLLLILLASGWLLNLPMPPRAVGFALLLLTGLPDMRFVLRDVLRVGSNE